MEVRFSWRKTQLEDLVECLDLHPAKNGMEFVEKAEAIKAWQQMRCMTHASRSSVVEMHTDGKVEIVGFGFGVFVSKDFAEAEALTPRPGLNARIIQSVVHGKSVIASYEEVRYANTRGDLQQVILYASWKNSRITPAQRNEVRVLLGMAYMDHFSGYRFSRVMTEVVDELDEWHLGGHRGFEIVDRFESFHQANPANAWNRERALAIATTESMRIDAGSIAAGLFQHRNTPHFAFTRGEQELLEAALEGADDASAARSLYVTLAAIKRRWTTIFERVSTVRPDLSPSDGGTTRGTQKRSRILTHLRNHPEELRPFDFSLKTKMPREKQTSHEDRVIAESAV